MKKRICATITTCVFLLPSISSANVNLAGTYIAAKTGLFQGSYNQKYIDQTDTIVQNVETYTQQRGYMGGLAIGYQTYCYQHKYLVGGELAAYFDTHHATFQSGASTSAFSDSINIKSHTDLTFIPGVVLTDTVSAYLKMGLSYAAVTDRLSSPVGFESTITSYNTSKNIVGFVTGIGISKSITPHVSLFAEGNYHDYGVIGFRSFENFSASYTHNVHIYSSSVEVGAAYHC